MPPCPALPVHRLRCRVDGCACPCSYVSKNGGFGDQMAWLEADLEAAAAKRAAGQVSWIIVAGHRAMYSMAGMNAEGQPTGDSAVLQQVFEKLFYTYGVDIVFAGHKHSYESQWPVYNTTNVVKSYDAPPYPVHIVSGAAGCDEGHTTYSNTTTAAWNRVANGVDYGLGLLTFQDANTLTWSFRRGSDGTVIDGFTLTR